MIDKVPPHDLEAEAYLLGGLLVSNASVGDVVSMLTPQCFYDPTHVEIFEAIVNTYRAAIPVDTITVSSELRKSGKIEAVGGSLKLVKLTNIVGSVSNLPFLAALIKDKYLLRCIINLSQESLSNAFKTGLTFSEVVSKLEKGLTTITSNLQYKGVVTSKELYNDALQMVDLMAKNKGLLTGVDTGLKDLNRLTNGFQKSDLIILAARPAMGKTSLALTLAAAPAFSGKTSLIFSLEMANRQLYARLLSQINNIPLHNILRSGMADAQLQKMLANADIFCNANLYFDDTGGLELSELCNKARKLKRDKGLDMLVIDYLQLIRCKNGGNREQEISEISRTLKSLAKELDIPVLALAQLSRETEKRANKTPMLSDLRESGAIEQDADIVMFIHRPEYYGITELEDGRSSAGIAEIIIAKHRNGGVGKVEVQFDGEFTKFTNINNYEHANF